VPRATVYRHRVPQRAAVPRRPGPVGPATDALEQIRAVLAASPFMGKAIARPGPGCGSPASAPRGGACCAWCANITFSPQPVSAHHAGRVTLMEPSIPDALNAMWGTDLTTALTTKGQAAGCFTLPSQEPRMISREVVNSAGHSSP
jgi:putative transposase